MADTEYSAGDNASGGDAMGLFERLKRWYKDDIGHVNEWRKEAREDWDFYNNRQWSDTDLKAMAAKKRPPLVLNRIAPLVNAVVGSEINNRREVRYFPREAGDAVQNEVLTAAGEWFRDECGAEDQESDAWKGTVVAGMGWTDTRLDFTSNQDGDPLVEEIDAMEMVWDYCSTKPNLQDAQRIFRVRELPYEEAVELTGEKDRAKLNAAWAKDSTSANDPHDQDASDQYDGTQSAGDEGNYYKKFCIVEARWLEKEVYYRGPDLEKPGEVREYDAKQYEAANKLFREQQGKDFPAVKQTRKVVRRAFLGSDILGKPDEPMVPAGMFGWECITGYKDKNKNHWYGIVRVAKDPARWSNKFFSQVQFLLNSQAKGGVLAERGAFENDRQAEQSWAKADEITWVNPGSLSGDKPKIMPKSPAQFPAGFFTLFQEMKESVNDVTGLSMEFLGTREVDQAGVLEYQRKQSSLNLLAELFNSLRRYRKRQGKTMLYLIQEHLADGRLIRIVGDDLAQYVPLMKAEGIAKAKQEAMQQAPQQIMQFVQQGMPPEQAKQQVMGAIQAKFAKMRPVDGDYDIIVDDSPTSPNEKDRTWQILMQMLPMLKNLITPEIAIELLGLSPLPASLVEKLKKKAAEAAQKPKPPTPEEQQLMASREEHQMDMAGKAADLQSKEKQNEMDVQMKGIDLMAKVQEAQIDQRIAEQQLQNDQARLAIQAEANAVQRQNANSRQTQAAKA